MRDIRSLVDAILYILGGIVGIGILVTTFSHSHKPRPRRSTRVFRIFLSTIRGSSRNRSRRLAPCRQSTGLFSWTPPLYG